ncbi:MAG: metallophosphatase [Prevotella sp.]|nr:metallophosphatase [Prevotella sp.]
MRHIIITLTIALTLTLNVVAKKKQIVILHTNDTHSCIYPLNPTLADTLLAGRGGYIRRAEMIKMQRTEYPNLLLIDSGDFSQGSPYYTMYKGDVEIGLMNKMGYDVATIGNHEFDFGVDNMARLFKEAEFPIVCANYDFTGTALEEIVKPYTIIKRNHLKIGVFGISPQLEGLVFAKTCEGVNYNDPIKAANEVADLLKNKEKCDLVICISHLGWNVGGIDDNMMMAQTRNIDIVLGGHSHTYLQTIQYVKNLDGKEIPNDQNGKSGIFVGKIILDLDKARK